MCVCSKALAFQERTHTKPDSGSENAVCTVMNPPGYLACARCSGSGSLIVAEPVASVGFDDRPLQEPTTQRCPNCSGAAKVCHSSPITFKLGS